MHHCLLNQGLRSFFSVSDAPSGMRSHRHTPIGPCGPKVQRRRPSGGFWHAKAIRWASPSPSSFRRYWRRGLRRSRAASRFFHKRLADPLDGRASDLQCFGDGLVVPAGTVGHHIGLQENPRVHQLSRGDLASRKHLLQHPSFLLRQRHDIPLLYRRSPYLDMTIPLAKRPTNVNQITSNGALVACRGVQSHRSSVVPDRACIGGDSKS